MRFPTLALFALSAVSLVFGQNGTGAANEVLGIVSTCNNELQSSPAEDITSKLVSVTAQLQSLGSSLQCDPSTASQIAIQGASIISHVAKQGMSVGPDALGGDVQGALKGFLEGIGRCVEGTDKEISRTLPVNVQVFLKNNVGDAMAVLSQAENKPPVVATTVNIGTGGGSGIKVGGALVSTEL
ncbi:unnamed protein product [Rhizoctonia solani]|uniref:Uncharacterized protein n=1 Tax=Rhizoctonia solani TaxID=456999 RepID=A0A8H3HL23_9AGAM|nr:unnamed protein product [Rhizoctonia solani]